MKIIKFFLLGLGIFILYMTIKAVGFHQIASHISELKWKLLPLLFIYPFIFASEFIEADTIPISHKPDFTSTSITDE